MATFKKVGNVEYNVSDPDGLAAYNAALGNPSTPASSPPLTDDEKRTQVPPVTPPPSYNNPAATPAQNIDLNASAYSSAANYSGTSIVDFLNQAGQPSDFTSRTKLATQYGISNYSGTAQQNTQLLGILKGLATKPASSSGATPPATGGGSDISQEEYKIKPGESLYDYNLRIARLRGESDFSVPNVDDAGATSVQYNTQQEIAKINEEANKLQQDEFSYLTSNTSPTVDLSTSAKLAEKLLQSLETTPSPTTPSLVQTFQQQRQELGVGQLEDELAGVKGDIAKLDADYASTLEGEEQRRVSLGQVRKRQGAVDVEYRRQRRDLIAEQQVLADQLDTKYGLLNTIVSLTNTDYQNATSKYNSELNKAISIINLVRGIESDQISKQERVQDNARANVQIMYNLLKDGNISYDDLSQADKANVSKMEAMAGLPTGFVKYVSNTIDEPAVSFLSAFTDTNGNRIQPIATVGSDGSYKINNVSVGKVDSDDGGGNDGKIISQATLNRLGAAGVPEVVALDIQRSLNSGVAEDVIRKHLSDQVGQTLGGQYMDSFNEVMKSSGTVLIP